MPKNLLDETEITLEKLREQFQNNDFTKTALKLYSEYTLEEVKFHNEIRSYVHESWKELLKEFGIKNPEACFLKDYPPELVREYLEKLIADIIISIDRDEKVLENILETFVFPILEEENCDELADRYLHNTVNALMQTVNIKGLAEVSKDCSCDEDFSKIQNTNYPKEVNYMKIPKMILFDYGQTLITEQKFDGVKGTEAVLQYAAKNKYHLSAEQVQAKANEINREFGRFDPEKRHLFQIEIPNTMFTPYLYESQGIEIALSNSEIDTVFWNAAAPGMPTEGIEDFLDYLKSKGIRTGVISNISYAPSVVTERINRLLPKNTFEFIITSSNFMFRKPNKRIFDLALEKAELQANEVWYIGDHYECDVRGSLNAGMLPIWYIGAVDLPYTEDRNILTITDWDELRLRLGE